MARGMLPTLDALQQAHMQHAVAQLLAKDKAWAGLPGDDDDGDTSGSGGGGLAKQLQGGQGNSNSGGGAAAAAEDSDDEDERPRMGWGGGRDEDVQVNRRYTVVGSLLSLAPPSSSARMLTFAHHLYLFWHAHCVFFFSLVRSVVESLVESFAHVPPFGHFFCPPLLPLPPPPRPKIDVEAEQEFIANDTVQKEVKLMRVRGQRHGASLPRGHEEVKSSMHANIDGFKIEMAKVREGGVHVCVYSEITKMRHCWCPLHCWSFLPFVFSPCIPSQM